MNASIRNRPTLHGLPALLALLAGCAAGVPAASSSPQLAEASTVCGSEREAAYRAREDLLERETLYTNENAAQKVHADALCETEAFERMEVAPGNPDDVVASLRRVRAQYSTALTLYNEVANYGATPWNVAANAGIGRLNGLFAAKLRLAPGGAPMTELAVVFEERAARAHRRVVGAIEASKSFIARYPEAAQWRREACLALGRNGAPTVAGGTRVAVVVQY